MKVKHVVLRNTSRSVTRDPFAGSFTGNRGFDVPLPPALRMEIEEVDTRKLSVIGANADVVAIAPVMPMKLIAPVTEEISESETAKPLWGINAVGADTSPFTGIDSVIAVLDTGIDTSHEAFSGVQLIERDFTGEGNGDLHGHGTHCAGTIFGRDIQGSRIGIARGVKKALIGKVFGKEGGGSTDQILDGILWAVDQGATIISMSLGMDFSGLVHALVEKGFPLELSTSQALEAYRANTMLFERLASLIRAHGSFSQSAVIIGSAGNDSQRNHHPDWKVAVAPPAVSDGIISVGAVGEDEGGYSIASFSNSGANIISPGVNILSAAAGGGLHVLSGTSMAANHVAGLAALWSEKILQTGPLSSGLLSAKLIGMAGTKDLKPGFDPFDIGAGMVYAPQG
jgi:subtilisin family serine protease